MRHPLKRAQLKLHWIETSMGMKVKPLWIVSFSHTIDMIDNWLDLQHNMYASSNSVNVCWLLPKTGREKCSAKPVRAFVPQFNGFSMTSCMFCQNPLTPEPFWLIKWVYLQLNHPGVVSGAGSEPDVFCLATMRIEMALPPQHNASKCRGHSQNVCRVWSCFVRLNK